MTGLQIINTYHIAHISDIHFGFNPFLHTYYKKRIGNALCRNLEKEKLNFLVVTGDITVSATEKQFRNAYYYFNALLGRINLNWSDFLIIPGNHDDNCRVFGNKYRPGFRFSKFNKYFQINTKIPIRNIGNNGVDVYQFFPVENPEVLIFGISSMDAGTYARGSIAIESLNWIEDIIAKFIERNLKPVVVIAIHHHPSGVSNLPLQDDSCILINSPQFMSRIKGLEVDSVIVIHGHQHAYWEKYIHKEDKHIVGKVAIISSGTATGRPTPSSLKNQYSLIKINKLINDRWHINVESKTFSDVKEKFIKVDEDECYF